MIWDGQCSNYYGVQTGSEDEWCWNYELGFTLNDAPGHAVMHFCSPDCEQEWWANRWPIWSRNIDEKSGGIRAEE
jgi:hypothetical protein